MATWTISWLALLIFPRFEDIVEEPEEAASRNVMS